MPGVRNNTEGIKFKSKHMFEEMLLAAMHLHGDGNSAHKNTPCQGMSESREDCSTFSLMQLSASKLQIIPGAYLFS
jgi:hypothetical protein